MILEIAAPAAFPLGPILYDAQGQVRPALLLASLQHPPVQLAVERGAGFSITGPRAHIAHEFIRHFYDHHRLSPEDTIEIELAIPSLMGLGSDSLLGLAAAKGLARLHGLAEDAAALSKAIGLQGAGRFQNQAFDIGGLLVLDTVESERGGFKALQRLEVSHPERDAWAFVFYFPFPPDGADESEENLRLQQLLAAASSWEGPGDAIQAGLMDSLVAQDDIQGFGRLLESASAAGWEMMGADKGEIEAQHAPLFEIMHSEGAQAWGQALNGYSIWCLVRGGDASRRIRKRIQDQVGYFGGRVMATVIDNRGANIVENKGRLGIGPSMRPRPGISSSQDD